MRAALSAYTGVRPDAILVTNGSDDALDLVCRTYLEPGDDVVVVWPTYGHFLIYVKARGVQPRLALSDDPFAVQTATILDTIRDDTKLVYIPSPNNPTGTVTPPADIAALCRAFSGTLFLVDEAYFEFLDKPLDLLPEIRSGRKPNLLLMRTFSKIYGLAGLRLGYGIGHPELIAELEKIRQPFNLNAVAQAGAVAALDDTAHAEKTRRLNSRGLKLFVRAFRKLGLEHIPSAANFILVRVGEGQRVFNEMQRLGVIVRPMGGYQLPEWVRISIGTPKENQRCLAALKTALAKPEPSALQS